MNWAKLLNDLYIGLVIIISIYGLHGIVITVLYLLHFRKPNLSPHVPEEWPLVTVQLPLYNEQAVAERMIDKVLTLDYPKERLIIQILDDSTDQTTEMARQRVEYYCSLGYRMELLHRTKRDGYKASALKEGLERTNAEFIAVFDADFLPPADFLRRTVPYFYDHPEVGMVQARWGHLNRDANLLTRTQALLLDGHQVVEQVARSRSNLFLNFNGTGGVWRAGCIRDGGGWQWDNLAEDVDLSYRVQMKGWKMAFLPDLIVPGQLPPSLLVFKKQQNRWVFGHIQVLRKILPRLWTSPQVSLVQRLAGTFHLATNLAQPVALLMFLISVPLAVLHPAQPHSLSIISLASAGPTLLFAVSQIFGYRDGFRRMLGRLLHLPILVLLAIGLTVSNSVAIARVFAGKKMVWNVTPKSDRAGADKTSNAAPVVPISVWAEIGLSIYCAIGLSLAIRQAAELIPLTVLGMLSYGFVGFSGLVEANRPKKSSAVKVEMARE